MQDFLLFGLAFLVIYFGSRILGRVDALPRHKSDAETTFELCDEWVTIRPDYIDEDEFKIEYLDGWQIGRVFRISGDILSRGEDDEGEEDGPLEKRIDLNFGKRATVQVYPMSGWYDSSRIGQAHCGDGKAGTIYVGLPYQIAQTALEELRRQPKQDVSIGIKKSEAKDGKVTYGVYSFELSARSDVEQNS